MRDLFGDVEASRAVFVLVSTPEDLAKNGVVSKIASRMSVVMYIACAELFDIRLLPVYPRWR